MRVLAADEGTGIEFLGERVKFGIIEKVKQFELPPLPPGKYEYRHTYAGKPIDFAPTGILTLEIHEYTQLRKNWNDTKHRKLEDAVPEFVATLMKTAVAIHRSTEERRREEREEKERVAAFEKLQAEVRQEKRRVDDLLKMTENWKRAQTIRDFLNVYRNILETEQQPIASGSELEKWLDWAERQADRLDPLVQCSPSILDRAHELFPGNNDLED